MNVAAIAQRYITSRLSDYIIELSEFARIPSVSSHGSAIPEAASFLAAALSRRGFTTQTIKTAGHPVVYGELGSGSKTVLLYNHYDVQPADPAEAWDSDPFEPVLRNGTLVARGIIDDKGEIVARLAAIDALVEQFGKVPLIIKFMVEGEEEIGSPNLEQFLISEKARVRADACIWEAGMVSAEGRPQLWLGLRGLLYVELAARTLSRDAHSGWAHILPNAAWRLVQALSTLRNVSEELTIRGILEGAMPPSASQDELLAKMPAEDDDYRAEYGVDRFVGGKQGLDLRRAVFTPTCNIAGIWSGYQGPGDKTVIPSEARAKLDFRLVPGQDPSAILQSLRDHFDRLGFDDIEILFENGQRGAAVDPKDPFVQLAISVSESVYGKEPIVSPMVGGTGPAALVHKHLNVPFVSLGCSYPGSRKHAPNENIRLDDFVRGASCISQLLYEFSRS